MIKLDPRRHPLLYRISRRALWIGQDDYPAFIEWADEHEKWLQFLSERGEFDRFRPRLESSAAKRDETFAEIGAAYFLEKRCGLALTAWEPPGVGRTTGEFLVGVRPGQQIFVEVKSPGWEAEIVAAEGFASPRLQQPKYLDVESRWTNPWEPVRKSIAKAYPKMPDSMPTLLIIHGDLIVPLTEWRQNVEIALYCKRVNGHKTGYLAEDGCFVDPRYERLGAVGILNVTLRTGDLTAGTFDYAFSFFRNPRALKAVALPEGIFLGYPSYDGWKE